MGMPTRDRYIIDDNIALVATPQCHHRTIQYKVLTCHFSVTQRKHPLWQCWLWGCRNGIELRCILRFNRSCLARSRNGHRYFLAIGLQIGGRMPDVPDKGIILLLWCNGLFSPNKKEAMRADLQ